MEILLAVGWFDPANAVSQRVEEQDHGHDHHHTNELARELIDTWSYESDQCLSTDARFGITPNIRSLNSLYNGENSIKAAVLAEPSPWTVSQWVTQLFR